MTRIIFYCIVIIMNDTQPVLREGYLEGLFSPDMLNLTVDTMCDMIKKSGVEFEAIAFRGVSGGMVAPMVGAKLGKTLIVVRKPSENSHDGSELVGHILAKKVIIVDDFISSGSTVESILKAMTPDMSCEGIFLYRSACNSCSHKTEMSFYAGRRSTSEYVTIKLFHMAINTRVKKVIRFLNEWVNGGQDLI